MQNLFSKDIDYLCVMDLLSVNEVTLGVISLNLHNVVFSRILEDGDIECKMTSGDVLTLIKDPKVYTSLGHKTNSKRPLGSLGKAMRGG